MEDIVKIPCTNKEHKNLMILRMWKPFINNPTETEIRILALILIDSTDTLTRDLRHTVRTKLDIDKFTFNNHIQRLKEKTILYTDKEGKIKINPNIIAIVNKNKFTIEFNESA